MSKYRITATFFTPSYLKLNPVFHPELRTLVISSEPLENVYREDVTIYNTYAQSETGYLAAIFKTDRAYDRTPVGVPRCPDRELLILNENGNRVPAGGSVRYALKTLTSGDTGISRRKMKKPSGEASITPETWEGSSRTETS